jgi:hypothetical protein
MSWVAKLSSHTARSLRSSGPRRSSLGPQVEALEGRQLLSTLSAIGWNAPEMIRASMKNRVVTPDRRSPQARETSDGFLTGFLPLAHTLF